MGTALKLLLIGLGRPRRQCQRLAIFHFQRVAQRGSDENDGTERRKALEDFQKAVNVVRRDTGSVPEWLRTSVDTAAAEAAKQNQ
jgi:hypothetical protein